MNISKHLVLIAILITVASTAFSSGDHNPVYIKNWNKIANITADNMHDTMKRLHNLDIDIAGVDVRNKIIDIMINDYDYNTLTKLGFNLSISMVKGVSMKPDEDYKNPEEIESYLKEIHNKFPHITKLRSIGKSLEGRDIWALKISDNPHEREIDEPAVLFNSMHHAREVMGPEMGWDIIEKLTNGYGNDEQITTWVENNEIWVMPMFNVDGNNKMWNHDSMWRKNTRGGYGVDLNRNYPTGWNKCNGSSGWRSSQTYRGPDPASEPETQAMMTFIQDIRPVFDISYHSYSELVIYPYGCEAERTKTKEVVEKIGNKLGELLDYKAGTAWELLYNADGGDIDWMYEAFQVIPFVIELNSRGEGFHPRYAKWRDKTVERNSVGWQYLLKRLKESGIRGQVTTNGVALADFIVEVFKIESNEKKHYQNYVGHATGAFHLVLNPGKYEINIKGADGTLWSEEIQVNEKLVNLNVSI